MMKKILGLDLGTNSIGWALVNQDFENKKGEILGMGSRIIPMGADKIDYEKGVGITKNADRRIARSIRKMNKRYKLRRNKLLYILYELGMLPEQFQFKNGIPDANRLQEMELLPIKKGTMQLDSLQHYELQVNAIREKVELKELGKILYRFNQLRGYAGGSDEDEVPKRGKGTEDEENETKKNYEVIIEKVEIVKAEKSNRYFKYKGEDQNYFDVVIKFEDEEVEGQTKLQNLNPGEEELEIRIRRNKKGEVSYEFALPRKTNWRKQMEATEEKLKTEKLFISELLLQDLKSNKWIKTRNRVLLRNRYKQEFDAIWEEQSKHYQILSNCSVGVLEKIACYLYPGPSESQKKLRESAINGGLKYIIKEQVIYYQRPLKSQSDFISKCQFETEEQVLPVSHPLFQEFRCWDQINRMYITSKLQVWNEKNKKYTYKYIDRYLINEQKQEIYNKLQNQKQISFSDVAKIVELKNDKTEYLNGLNVKDKLKGCDTVISIKKELGDFYDKLIVKDNRIIIDIWNTLYNKVGNEYDVDSEKVSVLISILKHYLDNDLATQLSLKLAQKIKFTRKYSSLSAKAIENILPLMQLKSLDSNEKARNKIQKIKHIIETGEIKDEDGVETYMIDYLYNNPNVVETGGLMYPFAVSLVYGKHTKNDVKRDITDYHQIKYNPNRKLRNPIVEQITNEALQIIKSLWKRYKLNPDELEIRVELARDLKNSVIEREKIYKAQIKNRQINENIKKRLIELKQDPTPGNIEIYKLWSMQNIEDYPKQSKEPTLEDIQKLRIWEEQKCVSPYTLKPIPLSKLFSPERFYDIDHIVPKSRYFDDSISNKVVCETDINEEKSNRTAWEYISQQNSKFEICSVEKYIQHVNDIFYGRKKRNLLLEKIPLDPVLRQMKNTQYISVAVKNELTRIVGSNNVKSSTGEITAFLRSKWGLRKLLMNLTESRFKQMELWGWNKETNQPNSSWVNKYFDKDKNKHVYEIKNWSKRYDHRHHAIDALVVALTEQSYIHRLNNLNKELQDWLEKNKDRIQLEVGEDETVLEAFFNMEENRREEIQQQIEGFRKFDMPFSDLINQAKTYLETMIVSHKPKDKLGIKIDEKTAGKQLKIRAALHEATYYGKWNGLDTKTLDISALSAKDIPKILDKTLREEIDAHRKKKEYNSMKEAFTGEGLKAFNENRFQRKNPDKLKPPVFKIKVRYNSKENEESKLQRLYDHNDKQSVVTGDNYLFLVMEKDGKKGKERVFDIASLYDSADIAKRVLQENDENFKQRICEDFRVKHKEKPDRVLFSLQQNDLVYLPEDKEDPILKFTNEEFHEWFEVEKKDQTGKKRKENKIKFSIRVYKVVKFTGKDCFFIPHNYSNPISVPKTLTEEQKEALKKQYEDKKIPKQELNYQEFGSFGTAVKTEVNENFIKELVLKKEFKGEKPKKIQDTCIKLQIDWLGNVKLFK